MNTVNKVGLWTQANPIDEYNGRSYSFLRFHAGMWFGIADEMEASMEFATPRRIGSYDPVASSDVYFYKHALGYDISSIDLTQSLSTGDKYKSLFVGCLSFTDEYDDNFQYVCHLISEKSDGYVYFESDGALAKDGKVVDNLRTDENWLHWLSKQPTNSEYRQKLQCIVTTIRYDDYLNKLKNLFPGTPVFYLPVLEVPDYPWTEEIVPITLRPYDYYMLTWFTKWKEIVTKDVDEIDPKVPGWKFLFRADVSIMGKNQYIKRYDLEHFAFTMKKNYMHQELTEELKKCKCFHGTNLDSGRITSKIIEAARAGCLTTIGDRMPGLVPEAKGWDLIDKYLFVKDCYDEGVTLAPTFEFINNCLGNDEYCEHVQRLREFVKLNHTVESQRDTISKIVDAINTRR